MKLKKYVKQTLKISGRRAAKQLGVNTETFRTWMEDICIPGHDAMVDLFIWSNGHVQPNDFYDLPDLVEGGAREGDLLAGCDDENDDRSPDTRGERVGSPSLHTDVLPGQRSLFGSLFERIGA